MTIYTEQQLIEIIGQYGGNVEQFYGSSYYKKHGYLQKSGGTWESFIKQLNQIFEYVEKMGRKKDENGIKVTKYKVGSVKDNINFVADQRAHNKRHKSSHELEMAKLAYSIVYDICRNIGRDTEFTAKGWAWQFNYPMEISRERFPNSLLVTFGDDGYTIRTEFENEMKVQAQKSVLSVLKELQKEGKILLIETEQLFADKKKVDADDTTRDEFKKVRERICNKHGISVRGYMFYHSPLNDVITKEIVKETGYTKLVTLYHVRPLIEIDINSIDIRKQKLEYFKYYYLKLNDLFVKRHNDYKKKKLHYAIDSNEKGFFNHQITDDDKQYNKYNTPFRRLFKHHMFFLLQAQGAYDYMNSSIYYDFDLYKENLQLAANAYSNISTAPDHKIMDMNMRQISGFERVYGKGFGDTSKLFEEYEKEYWHKHYLDDRKQKKLKAKSDLNKIVDEGLDGLF